jgi:hypothetical protein
MLSNTFRWRKAVGGYEKVGARIRERLSVLGYVKSDGELDIARFGFDFRFDKTNLYNWLGEKSVPFKDLGRLCTALQCSSDWLLFGRELVPKAQPGRARQHGKLRSLLLAFAVGGGLALPSAGGAAEDHTLSVVNPQTENPPYRKSRRFRNVCRPFGRGMACAA